jgi:hypothetical protein
VQSRIMIKGTTSSLYTFHEERLVKKNIICYFR